MIPASGDGRAPFLHLGFTGAVKSCIIDSRSIERMNKMARGFQGMPGGNMQAMARQAQKLQQQMAKMQEELEAKEFEASAGGGVVSAKVNGKHELLEIKIKPEAVDPEDVEMLEDMVKAAVNEAMRIAGEATEREMSKLTGGLNIPGLF